MDLSDTILELVKAHFHDLDWDNFDSKCTNFHQDLKTKLAENNATPEDLTKCLLSFANRKVDTFEEEVLRVLASGLLRNNTTQ